MNEQQATGNVPESDLNLSPLAQANPNALAELFSRDPLSLTDQDIDSMVALLRQQRTHWAETEIAKANKEKKPKKSPTATPSGDLSAVLATLGLD